MQHRMRTMAVATLIAIGTVVVSYAALADMGPAANSGLSHFDPKGKPPSQHTIEMLNETRETLPFSDTRDLEENRKGFIAPTREIREPIEELVVDGVRMIFHLTPDTEAPTEMNTYLPDLKALWMAENVQHGMHNIYTLL